MARAWTWTGLVAAGVCRTDLHLAAGDLEAKRPPVMPGHEVVGRVVHVGEGVADIALGVRPRVTAHLFADATQTPYDLEHGLVRGAAVLDMGDRGDMGEDASTATGQAS